MYRGEGEPELREKLSNAIARGDHFKKMAMQAKDDLSRVCAERNAAIVERNMLEQRMQALRAQHSAQTKKWLFMAVLFGALLLNNMLRYL